MSSYNNYNTLYDSCGFTQVLPKHQNMSDDELKRELIEVKRSGFHNQAYSIYDELLLRARRTDG